MVMNAEALRSPYFYGGALTVAFGAFVLWESASYGLGSVLRMGPGFFPTLLGGVLLVLGLLLFVRSFRGTVDVISRPEFGALICIGGGLALFAAILPRFGLAPAIFLLVLVASCASPFSRPLQSVVLAALLTAFSWFVFIWLLSMPLPMLSW